MKLMEYQAQQLFEKFGVPVKAGCVIDNVESIAPAMEKKNARTFRHCRRVRAAAFRGYSSLRAAL